MLICEGAGEIESPLNALSIEEHIEHYVRLGRSKMEAVKLVAKERSLPKNEVYKYTIKDREEK